MLVREQGRVNVPTGFREVVFSVYWGVVHERFSCAAA